jgi:hypothetical protein
LQLNIEAPSARYHVQSISIVVSRPFYLDFEWLGMVCLTISKNRRTRIPGLIKVLHVIPA